MRRFWKWIIYLKLTKDINSSFSNMIEGPYIKHDWVVLFVCWDWLKFIEFELMWVVVRLILVDDGLCLILMNVAWVFLIWIDFGGLWLIFVDVAWLLMMFQYFSIFSLILVFFVWFKLIFYDFVWFVLTLLDCCWFSLILN